MPERASKTLTPISGTEGVLAQRLLQLGLDQLGHKWLQREEKEGGCNAEIRCW
jgi:hypothetical protein